MTRRSELPKRVYFDHNATTALRREVVRAMGPFLRARPGNASSLHFFGQESREAVEEARARVAALIGAETEEVVFTSGGTESNNLAIRGVVSAPGRRAGSPHIITSAIEHPSVMRTCQAIENDGVAVTYLPCTGDGIVRADLCACALRAETALVSVMLANNETGVIQPIAEIAERARSHGAVFHVDAVQGVGRMPIHVDDLGADLLSISAHKFYGPKGVGALYVRRGTPITAIHTGGGHESGLRPGTENVPGIVGFGEACRLSRIHLDDETARVEALRNRLEQGVLACCGGITVNGAGAPRLPNTSNFTVSRIEGEAVSLNLSTLGFAVSSGSACASRSGEPSHVLRAMGLDLVDAQSTIRISLGRENTVEDVEAFLDVFPGVVRRLRELSPLQG
ncbi:MAG TPA: cysteine desulfurase family protein [Patescibacteria group bacterium]|nr:cysteine desulfurase family protein [Patescibacteria group bacterium]